MTPKLGCSRWSANTFLRVQLEYIFNFTILLNYFSTNDLPLQQLARPLGTLHHSHSSFPTQHSLLRPLDRLHLSVPGIKALNLQIIKPFAPQTALARLKIRPIARRVPSDPRASASPSPSAQEALPFPQFPKAPHHNHPSLRAAKTGAAPSALDCRTCALAVGVFRGAEAALQAFPAEFSGARKGR